MQAPSVSDRVAFARVAAELGVNQPAISKIENSVTIEDNLRQQIAHVLGFTAEAIKNFSEEAVFNYFNTFNDSSGAGACSNYSTFNFNPIDKLVELFEENKKLYERLLQSEREKVELLKSK